MHNIWEMWFVEVRLFEKVFVKARLMGQNPVKLFTEQFKWILSLLPLQENPVQRKLFSNEFPFYCFIEKQLETLHERHSINLNQLVQKSRQADFSVYILKMSISTYLETTVKWTDSKGSWPSCCCLTPKMQQHICLFYFSAMHTNSVY